MTSIVDEIKDLIEHMDRMIAGKVVVDEKGHVATGHHPSEVAARVKVVLRSVLDLLHDDQR